MAIPTKELRNKLQQPKPTKLATKTAAGLAVNTSNKLFQLTETIEKNIIFKNSMEILIIIIASISL